MMNVCGFLDALTSKRLYAKAIFSTFIHMMNVCGLDDVSGWGKSRQSHVVEPIVLYLDKDVQLTILVPNLLVGAAKVDMGGETALDTQLRLLLIYSLRLSCKAWKMIVDESAEYNALCLAQYEYVMGPNAVIRVCLPREHNLITQFQLNLMWFSHSRHVSTRISQRILMSDLGDLSLQRFSKLRDELEMSFCAVEFYGTSFHPGASYWTCPADRV